MLLPGSFRLWPVLTLALWTLTRPKGNSNIPRCVGISMMPTKWQLWKELKLEEDGVASWLWLFIVWPGLLLPPVMLNKACSFFCFLCCDMALFFSVVSTSGMPGSLKWLDVVLMVAVTDCMFWGKIIIIIIIYTHVRMHVHMFPTKVRHLSAPVDWDDCLGWGRAEKGGKDVSLVTALNYPVLLDVTIQS